MRSGAIRQKRGREGMAKRRRVEILDTVPSASELISVEDSEKWLRFIRMWSTRSLLSSAAIVSRLKEVGSNLKLVTDMRGFYILHLAIKYNSEVIFEFILNENLHGGLLQLSVDFEPEGEGGEHEHEEGEYEEEEKKIPGRVTPMELAIIYNRVTMLDWLTILLVEKPLRWESTVSDMLKMSLSKKRTECARVLLSKFWQDMELSVAELYITELPETEPFNRFFSELVAKHSRTPENKNWMGAYLTLACYHRKGNFARRLIQDGRANSFVFIKTLPKNRLARGLASLITTGKDLLSIDDPTPDDKYGRIVYSGLKFEGNILTTVPLPGSFYASVHDQAAAAEDRAAEGRAAEKQQEYDLVNHYFVRAREKVV